MALDFPSSPTNGQVYDNFYYDSAKGVWKSLSSGASPNYITNAVISATAPNATTVPLTVKGASSQTVNLQEWKNSANTNLAYINNAGHFASKTLTVFSSAGAKSFGVGDDPSGQIELGREDGVASSPYIDFHSGATATDYDVRVQANGGTGSNAGGTLSVFGKMNAPSQPYARLRFTGSNPSYVAGNNVTIAMNTVDANIGNCYNTSNGRFTAPIAGRYLVTASLQFAFSSANASWSFNINVHKNGSYVAGTYESNYLATYFPARVSAIIDCNANDYLELRLFANTSFFMEGNPGDARNFAQFMLIS